MIRDKTVQTLFNERIIAIVRMSNTSLTLPTMKALAKGGLQAIEVTSNTPGYLNVIKEARDQIPQALIGAGTITTPELAVTALHAGAQFLVTPNVNVKVIDIAHQHDVPVIMGALTPSEIAEAFYHGADVIKLFPADSLGISYLQSVLAPLDQVPVFAVGGVRKETAREWLKAGASGIGLGSNLVRPDLAEKGDFDAIIMHAREWKEIVDSNN